MMKRKKIRNLVEEHLSQKDNFADDDELEEDSLVKSTVNDLLEGNVDDVPYENVVRDLGGFKSKVFPFEDTFSSKVYSGKKVSRNSLEFENDEDHEASESSSDNTDASFSRSQLSDRNVDKRKMHPKIDEMSDSLSAESDEETSSDDDSNVSPKKKVRFSLPSSDGALSSDGEEATDEDVTDEEDENDSDDNESEIEDDLSDDDGTEDHSSFLYSKSFKDEPSEVEKGLAIRNQLSLWEVLLESRIILQKCLVTSNTLPKHDKFVQVSSQFSSEEKDSMMECREKVWDLLEKLIFVQDKLRKQNQEFMKSRSEEISEEKDDDADDNDFNRKVKRRKLSEYPEILEKQYKEYVPYRDSVIQKWNDRTKVASGKFAKSNFSAFDQPILNQIEQIMSDKHRLIQKTYVKRSQYDIFGEEPTENKEETDSKKSNLEIDQEIFDDDDFYHKLLRDYIERKTCDISDPTQLGRKWIQLQSLRSKMKRKIDTRRTKGRKIDFKVYPKLVNFMAPDVSDRWEESAINELFSSIFGKNLINT